MKTFVIPVRDLTASGEAYAFAVKPAWLEEALSGCDLRADSDGRLAVVASMSGRDVVVRGRIEVDVVGTCVRCLEPARVAVRGEIQRLYVAPEVAMPRPKGSRARPEPQEPDEETDAEDDVDRYDGDSVVLDEAAREHILLEVPMNPLCREDCPGLAPAASPTPTKKPFEKLASIVLPKKE